MLDWLARTFRGGGGKLRKDIEASPYQEPGNLSVLLVTGGGLDPYVSLLANSLANHVQVMVFGYSRRYLSARVLFVQRVTPPQKLHSTERHLSSNKAFGAMLWILDDLVKNIVNTYYLSCAIRRLKPSFVHLQGHSPFLFILAFGSLLSGKFFWTIHDVELRESGHRVMDVINVFMTRVTVMAAILGLRSTAIIVHGDTLRRELSASWWASNKIYSIPHGNYDGIYNRLHIAKPKTPIAMFFGKIKPYKGLEMFIRCAVNVSRMIPSARFVIAGAGDLTPYLDLIEEAGPDLFEIRNHFISDEEIPMLFGRASVVVLPYTKASQSGVLAMAYTMGVPVVASKVGSLPEVIDHGKTGFLFESGNVSEMANYVYRLMSNRELCEEFSRNARQKASLALSWDEIAKRTLTLYLELGNDKRSGQKLDRS